MTTSLNLRSKKLRFLGIAVLFSAFMLAIFGGSSIGLDPNTPTVSADAMNVYFKFTDDRLKIVGDSQDKAHSGEVQAVSYNELLQLPIVFNSSSGAAPSGRAKSSEFSFTKHQDKASIGLLQASASGASLTSVTISFQKQGATGAMDTYQVVLQNVYVSSVQQIVTNGDGIQEVVTLVPAQVTWKDLTNKTQFGWDFNKGAAI